MRYSIFRKIVFGCLAGLLAAAASAGVLEVTSPANGDFVGGSTPISFRIRGGVNQVTVRATIVQSGGGASTSLQTTVTPDQNGDASGTITWNPSQSFPEGDYDITVTATETGNTYNSVMITVTLDRLAPRLFEFSPLNHTFINGPINITARIDEPPGNIEEWRVTVNDQDLPNNTGSTGTVSVMWDPTNIKEDGEQTVKIIVKDKARNESTQEITVTLDRASPQVIPVYPLNNQNVRPGSILTVAIDIVDASATSVDPLAVRVEIRDMSNNLIRPVARLRYDEVNSTTSRWVGRWRVISPVREFKLVITAIDKAGNPAVIQEVPLRLGR